MINADDAFAEYFASRVPDRRILRFGLEATADITARALRPTAEGTDFVLVAPHGEVPVSLHLPGRHNVLNALAAGTIAIACGVSLATIAEGLSAAQPVAGRQVARTLANGAVVIDDSYNANPGSLMAAVDTLAAASAQAHGEGWLVLGDMRELGADAEALHAEAGRRAKSAGIRRLYTLGPLSAAAAAAFGEGAHPFDDHASLADALRAELRAGVRCLVKGSRGSAMDRIVAALLSTGEDKPHVA